MNKTLNTSDVSDLKDNIGTTSKKKIANKLSSLYKQEHLSDSIQNLVEDIFRIMVKDVEIKVREALSECLKSSKELPKDIIESIIKDKDSVAVPFIKHYASLSNDDLIKILDIPGINRHKAVASRRNLPNEISSYIAEKCEEEVVGTLISNETAQIYDTTYQNIVSKYGQVERIQEKLIYRSELPISVIENIVLFLSEELKKKLILTHNLPRDLASDIVEQVKEKATLKISEDASSDKQIEDLVHQLYTSNRLTPSIVVRAICMGDLRFFEYSLVYLSNTPISEVRKVLYNNSLDFMVRNILRKAYIPKAMFPAVFNAIKIIKEIKFDCKKNDRDSFAHKVIERILSQSPSIEELSEEDISYLISKIS